MLKTIRFMDNMNKIILISIVVLLSACGRAPDATNSNITVCPAEPTTCGQYDLYGDQCYNYDTYEQLGYDVSEAARKCNLAHIER